ncbi:MAG TPA: hypothetical protein VGO11_05085 [Chthoniobacteraceae bacterium]|jgi:hypothetical protein|nr:hypothetical protein [Chthoniobacteraceae bacterium]
MRPLHSLLLLLALAIGTSGVELPKPDLTRIKVRLVPEDAEICVGEPSFLKFIVANDSDEPVRIACGGDYQNGLGRPDSFTVTVVNAAGEAVPKRESGLSMGGRCCGQTILAHDEYAFRLLLPHWVTITEPGAYTISAKRTLNFVDAALAKVADLQVEASTRITVVPADEERLWRVTKSLGDKVLAANSSQVRDEWQALRELADDGIVPWLLQALDKGEYGTIFEALRCLEKFKSDAAFAGLKKGLAITSKDLWDSAGHFGAPALVDNLRFCAADALARSPHPGAVAFLMDQRHDPNDSIRLAAVHAMKARLPPGEATPLLREMAADENYRVRGEALRYLQEIAAGK